MTVSTAGRRLAKSTRGCERAAYSPNKFLSCAESMMLGPSKLGAQIVMNANSKNRPQTQAKRPCPDCGTSLIKRSSSSCHPLMSSTYLVCKNPVCGATFTGTDEITHRLSPPSNPNPVIVLPYAPSTARRGVLQELGLPTDHESQPVQAALDSTKPGTQP